jgi:DNA gyrase subunit A
MEKEKTKNRKLVEKEITEEMKSAYIDYAMSVIVSRAIPDVRDGLKPVQRRILYTMYEDGMKAEAKFRKSATVIGACLGKYHPHGDQPVYEAAIRMAQPFSLRYPLIRGQGNIGSIDDPTEYAAMRYTEMKLSKMGEEMLRDIEKDTVDFMPNYDGTRKEPQVLPSPLPQLLLNGSVGIAVGMATNIPPHNLSEILDAAIYLLDHPKAHVEDLFKFIQGPDFPTGGLIFDKKEIVKAYCQGKGPIICRAKAQIVEGERQRKRILIEEIPYQVSKSQLLEELAKIISERKIEGIKDIRDESDREGLRIVIDLQKEADPNRILKLLYKFTQLQKVFHLNMVTLLDGIQPKLLNLIEILKAFLKHRKEVTIRRIKFDLKKTKERVHILEGLEKCLGKIDSLIKIIRNSENREKARERIMKVFKLDRIQAEAILETKLATLSRLERRKIKEELKEKENKIREFEVILKSPKKISQEIKKELRELKEKYGDKRKTTVIDRKIAEIKEEDLIEEEENLIFLTKKGYIKRVDPKGYRTQRRGTKGILGIKTKEGDFVEHFAICNTKDNLFLFTDSGKVFSIPIYEIPKESREGRGKLIFTIFNIPQKEKILALTPVKREEEREFLIFGTALGKIKKSRISSFKNIRSSGLIAISLKKGDFLKSVKKVKKDDLVLIYTKEGQGILFKEGEVREMGRKAEGILGIRLKKGDKVEGIEILPKKSKNVYLLTITENGFGKRTSLKEFRVQKRGGKGIKIAKINKKTGALIKTIPLLEQEELILVSEKGKTLKLKISSISKQKRVSQGTRLMKIEKDKLISAILI